MKVPYFANIQFFFFAFWFVWCYPLNTKENPDPLLSIAEALLSVAEHYSDFLEYF